VFSCMCALGAWRGSDLTLSILLHPAKRKLFEKAQAPQSGASAAAVHPAAHYYFRGSWSHPHHEQLVFFSST
jgi:hypothetical protein